MAKVSDVEVRLIQLEAKVDALFSLVGGRRATPQGEDDAKAVGELSRLTTKQHMALQLVIKGAQNNDIAKRFGCTENTAKVHLRSVAGKFGVRKRAQIALHGKKLIDSVEDDVYESIAGIPKDWADDA